MTNSCESTAEAVESVKSTAERHRYGGRVPRSWTLRFSVYLASTLGVGVGVAAMVAADLGVAPNDVLNTGLAHALGTEVGTASWVTGIVAMTIATVMGRRPRIPTIVGGVVVGTSINAVLAVLPDDPAPALRVVLLLAGLCVVWAGITGVVAVDVGAGPIELVMLAMMDRGISIRVARWGIELTLLGVGLLLGGAAGLGTALFAFGTGPVLAVTIPRATARLGTELSSPAEVAGTG